MEKTLTVTNNENYLRTLTNDFGIKSSMDVWGEALIEYMVDYKTINFPEWKLFTTVTGGLRGKEFTIICGPTGTGKTSFLANLSSQLIIQKVKHLVAPVEVGPVDFMMRVLSVLDNRDYVAKGKLTEKEYEYLSTQFKFIHDDKNLYISTIETRMSVEFLLSKLKYAYEVLGCRVAILDNLNFFLEVKSHNDSLIEMDRVVHELIMFCKNIDMHLILVMHPRKTLNGRVESEFDIKGSSTAVQESSNVFLFNKPRKEEIDSKIYLHEYRELMPIKLRKRGKHVGLSIIYDGREPYYRELLPGLQNKI